MTNKILCIVANPDARAGSFSSSVYRAFLDELRASQIDDEIKEVDLYETDIPALNSVMFDKAEIPGEGTEDFNFLLNQITNSDALIFVSQTIAFGLPARLKSLIEILVATRQIEKLRNKKGLHLQIEDDTLSPVYRTDEQDVFRDFLIEKSVEMMKTVKLPHHHQEAGELENVLLEVIEDTRTAARGFARFIK